jgi:hypothetical protein
LTISEHSKEITQQLITDYKYCLKDVGPPAKYLGAKVGKQMLSDGTQAWFISVEEYLKKAMPEIERKFGNIANLFRKSALDMPAPTDFHPELDTSDFLDEDGIWLYQSPSNAPMPQGNAVQLNMFCDVQGVRQLESYSS